MNILLDSPVKYIVANADKFTSVFFAAASISPMAIGALNVALKKCRDKRIVFGMFTEEETQQNVDAKYEAMRGNWKMFRHTDLHAKLCVAKIRRGNYVIIIGSSNIAFSKNTEINTVNLQNNVPRTLKEFMSSITTTKIPKYEVEDMYKRYYTIPTVG